MPQPEAYLAGTVTVPARRDIIDLVAIVNALEHQGLIGHPRYGTPLSAHYGTSEVREILARPFARSARDLERWGISRATLQRLVRRGDVERVGRGLYMLPGTEVTEHHSLVEAANKKVKSNWK